MRSRSSSDNSVIIIDLGTPSAEETTKSPAPDISSMKRKRMDADEEEWTWWIEVPPVSNYTRPESLPPMRTRSSKRTAPLEEFRESSEPRNFKRRKFIADVANITSPVKVTMTLGYNKEGDAKKGDARNETGEMCHLLLSPPRPKNFTHTPSPTPLPPSNSSCSKGSSPLFTDNPSGEHDKATIPSPIEFLRIFDADEDTGLRRGEWEALNDETAQPAADFLVDEIIDNQTNNESRSVLVGSNTLDLSLLGEEVVATRTVTDEVMTSWTTHLGDMVVEEMLGWGREARGMGELYNQGSLVGEQHGMVPYAVNNGEGGGGGSGGANVTSMSLSNEIVHGGNSNAAKGKAPEDVGSLQRLSEEVSRELDILSLQLLICKGGPTHSGIIDLPSFTSVVQPQNRLIDDPTVSSSNSLAIEQDLGLPRLPLSYSSESTDLFTTPPFHERPLFITPTRTLLTTTALSPSAACDSYDRTFYDAPLFGNSELSCATSSALVESDAFLEGYLGLASPATIAMREYEEE